VVAFAQAGGVARAPRLAVGAPPWPAPSDPMRLARRAGLKPELFEHLNYHVHSHLDISINGKRITIPAGIGTLTILASIAGLSLVDQRRTAVSSVARSRAFRRCTLTPTSASCTPKPRRQRRTGLASSSPSGACGLTGGVSVATANRTAYAFTSTAGHMRKTRATSCLPNTARSTTRAGFRKGHLERVDLQVVHRPGCCV
jgi:hypothetical protein